VVIVKKRALVFVLPASLVLATAATAAQPLFNKAEGAGSYGDAATVANPVCASAPTSPNLETQCIRFGVDFRFSAISSGFSEHAKGFYQQQTRRPNDTGVGGKVDCIEVLDNMASIGGTIDEGSGTSKPRVPFLVFVVDNGTDLADLISPLQIFPAGDPDIGSLPNGFPHVCPPPVSDAGYFAVDQGNIVVQRGLVTHGNG
jgi:hypothetical protein